MTAVPGRVPWAVYTSEHLNGRLATDWEAAALEHARRCEHDRDAALLAGVLTEVPVPRHEGRTVTGLAELS